MAWSQKTPTYQKLVELVGAPGVVFVQDSLSMDETEVANIYWLEYTSALKRDSTLAQYRAALPDSTVWQQIAPQDIFLSYYWRVPGLRFCPVVGISYAQAVRYCRWRTAVVNQNLHSSENLRKHPKLKHYTFRVVYRLPTVREWELAAAGGLDPAQYPFGGAYPPAPGSRGYKRQLQTPAGAACRPAAEAGSPVFSMDFNVRERSYRGSPKQAFNCPDLPNFRTNADGTLSDDSVLTEYVYAYPPNDYGLYCMIGNVAELTATPGIAKGGSFEHSTTDFTLLTNFSYTQPQEWLGFRCAATVYISPK
ncbi:MAG: formylglycine-generating enzyme family protein [Janthinobacterium lividum]